MTPNRARWLKTAILIMMVCVPVSLCYEFIDSVVSEDLGARISVVGLVIGIVLTTPLALVEESRFDGSMVRSCWTCAR